MEIYDVNGETVLTSIAFGDFLWGDAYFFPGKTTVDPRNTGPYYYVNNTDQMDFYVKFEAINAPSNVQIQVSMKRLDQTTWTNFAEDPYIYSLPLISKINNADPKVQALQFQLLVAVNPNAPFNDFTPTLVFSAVDSPTG